MKTASWLAVAIAVLVAPMAVAQDPDPAFVPEGLTQWEKGRSRGLDQARHPEFQQRALPFTSRALDDPAALSIDPYRANWSGGETREVMVPNRYGTPMHAVLYAPRASRRSRKSQKLPAVIVLTGGQGAQEGQWAYSQGLAEAGYVVLGLDVQGDGRSPAVPPDPVASTPENEYCRPYNHNGWQNPQEAGIVELNACAGQPPAPGSDPLAAYVAGVDFNVRALTSQTPDYAAVQDGYRGHTARKALGAIDAAKWLRSSANPLRRRTDAKSIGVIGYSLGAQGALVAGNGDPLRRFSAVVSLDSFGAPEAYSPAVPTLFVGHEIDMGLPKHHRPDDAATPSFRDAQRFRHARVPTMRVVPDGSTHLDFGFVQYVPLWAVASTIGTCPDCILGANASRDGERVSLYYAQAWFDRYLKRGRAATAARARMLADRFDASVDGSSIGQGTWDPAAGNVPYAIGGESVRAHLSPLFDSFADFGRAECADLRAGC